jgi:Flp pilus assembly secretin CpaC
LIGLLLGFTLTQIGMYMGNKFGRSPRPDEKLDAGLKGLQNEFVMYHYTTPVSHLLVGPAGIWVVMPYHQRGQVAFKKNRWRMSGGGFLQGYMRIFGQESLGRPEIEIDNEIKSLKKHLSKHMPESEIPEINALMVFTDDNVEIDAEDSPIPAMKLKQVKEYIRQRAKEKKVSGETLNKLKTVLE